MLLTANELIERRDRRPILTDAEFRLLARELQREPELTRFAFVRELLEDPRMDRRGGLGLYFAQRCLRSKAYLYWVFDFGLANADPSSIQFWLDALVPVLGIRRTVRYLSRQLAVYPRGVGFAIYWLGRHLPTDSVELLEEARALYRNADDVGAIRRPVLVPVYPQSPTE